MMQDDNDTLSGDVAELQSGLSGLRGRVEKLEGHVERTIDPALARLEIDMAEMRSDLRVMGIKMDSCANKNDVVEILRKIDEGNQNLSIALATPSQSQATASFWMAALGSAAMVAAAIAGIYALFIHH